MNPVTRLVKEYGALSHILSSKDLFALAAATAKTAPAILRSRKLTCLDAAMSRDIRVQYRGYELVVPVAKIDRYLAAHGGDNPTFGNIREMYALDCYLNRLNLPKPIGTVLDIGANRGMFSLLALVSLGAGLVIGVEPNAVYEPVVKLLLEANGIGCGREIRYSRFVTRSSAERQDPTRNISLDTIYAAHSIDRVGLAKIDIEGYEKELFTEPQWLARVDTLAMEIHPHLVGDLSVIPAALNLYGFRFICTGQFGEPRSIKDGTFLYASKTGALRS